MPTPRPLPMATMPPRVRRDAAANSDRILAAARTVIERDGVEALTMDGLAACAGVGKGTIFRAFGSRSGLFAALTDETEREFQQAHMTGPPPLGPGAPPLDRLLAYGAARLRMDRLHARLMLAAAQAPIDKFSVPARKVSAMHLRMLLRECGVERDVEVLAESLLSILDADVTHHLTTDRGMSQPDLLAGWHSLARAIVRGR
ncbi:TetR/AcrR family transcriptional regulator [Flexivirga sp.]|uniref:TetR/AcrR family transcriptional regulator n=1 Tax=Flexivirga sp. TaxID=1962927 RepID=UPI003F809642